MSQAQNPRDNQALLQSMLQRLKLQTVSTNIQSGPNGTEEHNALQETPDLQTFKNNNSGHQNGFDPRGNIKREVTESWITKETDRSPEGCRASGQSKNYGHNLLSQTEQLFSPRSVENPDAVFQGGYNFTPFKPKQETSVLYNGESAEQKQDQSNFASKVYAWTPKSSDIQENKVSFEGAFEQNTPTGNQNTSMNRKQRSSENKTRRWTQKLKEKWRERPGSFGKKEKNDKRVTTFSAENSPQYQSLTAGRFDLASPEPGGTPASEGVTDKTLSHTSNTSDEYMRSAGDFDLGLGSFSLLDEIVRGQKWAEFLNPSMSAADHNRPSAQTMDQTFTNSQCENSGVTSMLSDVRFNSRTLEKNTEGPDIAMALLLPEPLVPAGAEISAKSQIPSEPMDEGQSQSDLLVPIEEQQSLQPTAQTQAVNTEESSSLRGRNSLSRKRQYQSPQRTEAMFHSALTNGKDAQDDGSVFLPDDVRMDNTEGRPSSLFSFTPTPCSPVRGVLKPTLSCGSTNSMETLSKRRRVEDTRRVRFSEDIITITIPDPGPYESDSEEEKEREEDDEDSLTEDDSEENVSVLYEPIDLGHAAPTRRPVLPAWIRALKRRNPRKKPR